MFWYWLRDKSRGLKFRAPGFRSWLKEEICQTQPLIRALLLILLVSLDHLRWNCQKKLWILLCLGSSWRSAKIPHFLHRSPVPTEQKVAALLYSCPETFKKGPNNAILVLPYLCAFSSNT